IKIKFLDYAYNIVVSLNLSPWSHDPVSRAGLAHLSSVLGYDGVAVGRIRIKNMAFSLFSGNQD
ncbi:MAG: hypothetical protein OXD43_08570, partial [Bacteroidetes bacterium]|nr:hypothetical protein [Bacteroidota bacterium]